MKEPVILTWCDVHLSDREEKVEATWSGILKVGDLSRELDLCPECDTKIIGDLRSVLTTYGFEDMPRKPMGRPPNPATPREACPVCNEMFSTKSLSSHSRGVHGQPISVLRHDPTTLAAARRDWENRETGPTGKRTTSGNQLTCPDCTAGPFKGLAGLGVHRGRVHDAYVSSETSASAESRSA